MTHIPPRPDSCPRRSAFRHWPTAMGARLQADIQQLFVEFQATIPAVFEGEEYRRRLSQIDEEYTEPQTRAFCEEGEEAGKHGIILLRTPKGFLLCSPKAMR